MTTHVSADLVSRLCDHVAEHMGLHLPPDHRPDIEKRLAAAAAEQGFEDVEQFGEWLMSASLTRAQVELLASHLTVGETYFFRDKSTWAAIESEVLPELIASRRADGRHLRIWSAGCCTGEEPYSVAMLLSNMIHDIDDWNITILATDINPRFLKKAEDGVYTEWSFRSAPAWLKERYFGSAASGRFILAPRIRRMVRFSHLNLAEDSYPSLINSTNAMDLVICRNVLMYFAPERSAMAIHRFGRCLVEGGWLVVGPCDMLRAQQPGFEFVSFPGVVLYRKDASQPRPRDMALPTAKTPVASFPAYVRPPAFPGITWLPDDAVPVNAPIGGLAELVEPESAPATPTAEAPSTDGKQVSACAQALALYERGCYQDAVDLLLKNIPEPGGLPAAGDSLSLLARANANLGKLAEARTWAAKAAEIDKLNPGCHYLLATILRETGTAEEAVTALRRVLYLDEGFVLAHFSLGNLSQAQGNRAEARRHLRNALELLGKYRPDDPLPHSEGIAAGRMAEIVTSALERMGAQV